MMGTRKRRRPLSTIHSVRRVGLWAVFTVRFFDDGWDEQFVAAFADEQVAEELARRLQTE
jgi:hypothetical protein